MHFYEGSSHSYKQNLHRQQGKKSSDTKIKSTNKMEKSQISINHIKEIQKVYKDRDNRINSFEAFIIKENERSQAALNNISKEITQLIQEHAANVTRRLEKRREDFAALYAKFLNQTKTILGSTAANYLETQDIQFTDKLESLQIHKPEKVPGLTKLALMISQYGKVACGITTSFETSKDLKFPTLLQYHIKDSLDYLIDELFVKDDSKEEVKKRF